MLTDSLNFECKVKTILLNFKRIETKLRAYIG